MGNISRRKLLFLNSMGFKNIANFALFSLVALVVGFFFTSIIVGFDQSENGLLFLLVFSLVVFAIYLVSLVYHKLLDKYVANRGGSGKAIVHAINITVSSAVIGFAASRLTVAFQLDRLDNVIMWTIIIIFTLKSIFNQSKSQYEAGSKL